jgi:hypothetical protein
LNFIPKQEDFWNGAFGGGAGIWVKSGQLKFCNQGLYLKEKLRPSDKVFFKLGIKKKSLQISEI